MPDGIAGPDNPDGPADEITMDPLPAPRLPFSRLTRLPFSRLPRLPFSRPPRLPFSRPPHTPIPRLTRRGRLLAAIAAIIVVGSLKLGGVIWTTPPPTWVTALGTGVTVTGPEQVAPGRDSPGAALTGLLAVLSAKDSATRCDYISADTAVNCLASDQLPYRVSVKIGYVASDGARALVGFTGKICPPRTTPECVTNTDPAAIFSAGNTFAALWTQTVTASSSDLGSYRLVPCIKAAGKWYVASGPT